MKNESGILYLFPQTERVYLVSEREKHEIGLDRRHDEWYYNFRITVE